MSNSQLRLTGTIGLSSLLYLISTPCFSICIFTVVLFTVCRHDFLFTVIFYLESDILPYSIRVLLEAAVRNCDGFLMKKEDVMNILDWKTKQSNVEVPFFPARVVLQDFT